MSHPFGTDEKSILQGKRILLTRPAEVESEGGQGDALQQALTALGATVNAIPLVEIRPVACPWEPEASYDWLFFTSKNAVKQFFQASPLPGWVKTARIAVVGPATGQCVQDFGYPVSFVSPQYHAEAAAAAFCQTHACAGLRVLWPCGNLANPLLAETLQAAGAQVDPRVVYETVLKTDFSQAEQSLLQVKPHLLVFTSPSAVEAWANLTQSNLKETGHSFSDIPVACLGPRTVHAALQHLARADVQAVLHTLEALAEAIRVYFMEGNR